MNYIKKGWSAEAREKAAGRARKQWESPEYRKLRSEQVKIHWKNPELRRNFEKGLINGRSKLAKLREDENCRKEIGIKTKQNWKNPEYRKKITDATKLR